MSIDDAFQEQSHEASVLLKAMSNKHRLMVLHSLINGEKKVGDLEKEIGLSQSALSQHLARLRRDDLVKTRRQAQTIFYSLKGDQAISILQTLEEIFSGSGQLVKINKATA